VFVLFHYIANLLNDVSKRLDMGKVEVHWRMGGARGIAAYNIYEPGRASA